VSIAAGTKVTPKGQPTDAAFPGGSGGLSSGGKIAIAVVVVVVVLSALAFLSWWQRETIRSHIRKRRYRKPSGY